MKRLIFYSPLLILVICISAIIYWAMPQWCENSIFEVLDSPEGRLQAVMFERNCGATTGFSTQVSVLRKSPNFPNGSGNVFIAEGAPWTRDLAPSLFGMKWQNAKTLQINHPAGVRIYKSKKTIGGVAIQLNPIESQIQSR